MIRYEGNERVTVNLSNGESLNLSEYDLSEFYLLAKEYFTIEEDQREILRPYNKKEKIISLFNEYKTNEKTKADVFREISTELNISFKAVEKAHYTK